MPNFTLTHKERYKGNLKAGWPSFYSYLPDWIQGMNNYLYTFSGGNLWIHNENATRNNFYGVQYGSSIQFAVNDAPFEAKLFKAIAIEGNEAWDVLGTTNKEDNGFINSEYFQEQEGSYHAYIRNSGTTPAEEDEYPLRSTQGIGESTSISGTAAAKVINFPLTLNINSLVSIGDLVYNMTLPSTTPIWSGEITNIEVDKPAGINRITIDATAVGATEPVNATDYYMVTKNAIAESNGLVGHYGIFTLSNNSTTEVKLFGVGVETMRSYT